MLKIATGIALFMVVGGLLTHRLGLLPFNVAFYGFGFGLLNCSLLALISSAMVFRRLARKEALVRPLIITVLTVAPVLTVLMTVGVAGFRAPAIHDISTDVYDPPQFIYAQAQRKPGENSLIYGGKELASLQTEGYPDIKTIYLPETNQEQGMIAVKTVVDALGWQVLGEDSERGHIEAVETTPLMGFADDIAIRVRPLKDAVLIDLRSVSRVGLSDLGANAKRIERFVKELKVRY